MHTVDGQFSTGDSFWNRLTRDARLLVRMCGMVWTYFTEGRRIRRIYRRRESRGEVFWLDEEFER